MTDPMKITSTPHDDWPQCVATLSAQEVSKNLWEFRFPVPIPEELWKVRAQGPGGYWRGLKEKGPSITVSVKEGYVEGILIGTDGDIACWGKFELDLKCPGPPFDYGGFPGRNRQALILDDVTPEERGSEPGICRYCDEDVPEGAGECPECGTKTSQEAPTVGELVEEYGPDARVFVYFHDRSVSLNVSYTLDDAGLAKEKADRQAKYDADMAEYEELKAQWDELAEKVSAYNAAQLEADERAKFAELKDKYGGET